MNPRFSVVIATHNRGRMLLRLIEQFQAQTLNADAYEIIVVDDGSEEPVAPMLAQSERRAALQAARIPWSGQAVARHHGALMARGDVLVFVDDDMQIEPTFLQAQAAHHDGKANAVVFGQIRPAPGLGEMPLFERYHARQLERWRQDMLSGRVKPAGQQLCTGNVSMPRAAYLAVGGFNPALKRSEDRELGIRLEKHGCQIVYGDDVATVHCSDHAQLDVWLRRAYLYGRFDRQIAALHPDVPGAHPWKFWSLIHPLSRPIVTLSLVAPNAGRALSRAFYAVAAKLDSVQMTGVAMTLTAFCYALEYFAGLRDECGSFAAFRADARRATARVSAKAASLPVAVAAVAPAAVGTPGAARTPSAFRAFVDAVKADQASVRRNRQKYKLEASDRGGLLSDFITKIGFQMMVCYRVMRLAYAWRIPVLPMLISRFMRHLYSADIHWKADIGPGVSIVHGIGLIIAGSARVESDCILFQHVTLGESIDPISGAVGAPHLHRGVHVGAGAKLLGPIDVGEASKVGACAVLMRTVPPFSLVASPEVRVTQRRVPRQRAAQVTAPQQVA